MLKATLHLPLVRVIGHPLMGMALAGMCFGAGWFLRYSIRHGVGGAAGLFQQRLFDGLAMRPKPKPSPSPSASASPATTVATAVAPSPSPTPSARPRPSQRPPGQITIKNEVLELIANSGELQKSDKIALRQLVSAWTKPGGLEIIALCEAFEKMPYLKPLARRDLIQRLLLLETIAMPVFKIDKVEDAERIAKGWDVPELRRAIEADGPPGVKKLANGRPAKFFVDLAKEWPAFHTCRENLQALKEGRGIPETPKRGGESTPSPAPASPAPDASPGTEPPAVVECPSRGSYEPKGKGTWRCTIHQTLDQPYPAAERLQWYIQPTEDAIRSAKTTDPQNAVTLLQEVLRVHPNQVWAINGIADIYFDHKSWHLMKPHFERYLTSKDPINARWGWLMSMACLSQLDFEGAKKWANRTQNAAASALPPNFSTMLDFYLCKDRALEIRQAAQGGIRAEEYPFKKDDDQPSSQCLRNLTEVRTAIMTFVKDYPSSHPDLQKLREKLRKAEDLLKTPPAGASPETIRAKKKIIDDRIALLMSDTGGKMLWRSLVKLLAGYQVNPCPSGGRFTLERHQWLDCSNHPGVLGERLEWLTRTPPSPDEEIQLSRAILTGALAADPKRGACFQAQKEYVASRGSEGVTPGEITTSTKLPNGQPLACVSGEMTAIAKNATQATVTCGYHGSYEEYFSGVGEMKEEK